MCVGTGGSIDCLIFWILNLTHLMGNYTYASIHFARCLSGFLGGVMDHGMSIVLMIR
jgi:hypothetical protein